MMDTIMIIILSSCLIIILSLILFLRKRKSKSIVKQLKSSEMITCCCGCNEKILPGDISITLFGQPLKYGHTVQSYSLALQKPTTFTCCDLITDETQEIEISSIFK